MEQRTHKTVSSTVDSNALCGKNYTSGTTIETKRHSQTAAGRPTSKSTYKKQTNNKKQQKEEQYKSKVLAIKTQQMEQTINPHRQQQQ